ncbi:hypothetical protein GCM10009077_00240 [Roseibium denhamense]
MGKPTTANGGALFGCGPARPSPLASIDATQQRTTKRKIPTLARGSCDANVSFMLHLEREFAQLEAKDTARAGVEKDG